MRKKPHKSMESPTFASLGPFLTRADNDQPKIEAIIAAVDTFGGQPYARIYRDRLQGRRVDIVSLRYTNLRATVGPVPPEIARRLRWTLLLAAVLRRAITAPASVVTDRDSPDFRGVWFNVPPA